MKKYALLFAFCITLALVLLACTATTSSNTAAPAKPTGAVPTAWAMDVDCAACHTVEAATTTNQEALLAVHVEQAAVECVSCHNQTGPLGLVHKTMSTDVSKLTRLKRNNTKINESICIDCHGSWEDMAALTATSGITIDDSVAVAEYRVTLEQNNYKPVAKVINPHTVKTTLNASGSHNLVTCVDCHQVHVVGSTPQTAYKTSITACASCHHTGVFTCNVCHS